MHREKKSNQDKMINHTTFDDLYEIGIPDVLLNIIAYDSFQQKIILYSFCVSKKDCIIISFKSFVVFEGKEDNHTSEFGPTFSISIPLIMNTLKNLYLNVSLYDNFLQYSIVIMVLYFVLLLGR